MELVVDDRESEPTIQLTREIAKEVDCKFKIQRLPLGDFLIVDSSESAVIIERKSMGDFVSSMRSNRLWQQLTDLMKLENILDYPIKRKMLLIQGTANEYLSSIPEKRQKESLASFWGQFIGAQQEILFVYNTPIVFIENHSDALKAFFKIVIKREQQGKNDAFPQAKWYRKHKRITLSDKDFKNYVVASIPLIGDSLAKILLEHFKTISNIATASVHQLQQVPGIGKKKAERIYAIFH